MEFQDGDTSCKSSVTLKVGPVATNHCSLYVELVELSDLVQLLAANVFLKFKCEEITQTFILRLIL